MRKEPLINVILAKAVVRHFGIHNLLISMDPGFRRDDKFGVKMNPGSLINVILAKARIHNLWIAMDPEMSDPGRRRDDKFGVKMDPEMSDHGRRRDDKIRINRRLSKTDRWLITLVLALMLVIALVVTAYVLSGKSGTLVRNSLIARSLPEAAFAWQPGAEPGDFKQESLEPPAWFQTKFASLVVEGDDLAQVEASIRALHVQPFAGRPIRQDLQTTWRLIEERGRGYCADYSRLFTGLMLAAEIPVREWALGHEDFGSGHTFNEVFIDGRWVFVDAFNGMLIRDAVTGGLLSVLEFRERLEQRDFASLVVVKLTDPDSFFQTREEGLNYYARSGDFFYMLWGNNVFSYDVNPWIQGAAVIGRPLERLVAVLIGEYPHIRMLVTETNLLAREQVALLRTVLYLALALEVLLGFYLLHLFWKLLRNRPQQ